MISFTKAILKFGKPWPRCNRHRRTAPTTNTAPTASSGVRMILSTTEGRYLKPFAGLTSPTFSLPSLLAAAAHGHKHFFSGQYEPCAALRFKASIRSTTFAPLGLG